MRTATSIVEKHCHRLIIQHIWCKICSEEYGNKHIDGGDDSGTDQRDSTTASSEKITATQEINGSYERGTIKKIREGKGRDNLTMMMKEVLLLLRAQGDGKAHRDGFHVALQHHGVALRGHKREET